MGIDGIDNLIPNDDVVEIYPEWPDVRCAKCNNIYTIISQEFVHLAECPNCKNPTFKTKMNGVAINENY